MCEKKKYENIVLIKKHKSVKKKYLTNKNLSVKIA